MKGDKSSFEELMKVYMKIIYNYIIFRVSNADDANDILQDTMFSVWKSLSTYTSKSSFKTWVLGIANHRVNDYFRMKYRDSHVNIDDIEEPRVEEESIEKLITRVDMRKALELLKEDEKELVFLIFNAQLTYSEISELKQIPVGSIKSKMSAMKRKLQDKLGEGYYETM